MPTRRPNSELRPREHLTEREVEKLIAVPDPSGPTPMEAPCRSETLATG